MSVIEPLYIVFKKLKAPFNETMKLTMGEISDSILKLDIDSFLEETGFNRTRILEASTIRLEDFNLANSIVVQKSLNPAIFSFYELAKHVSENRNNSLMVTYTTRTNSMIKTIPFSKLLKYFDLSFELYHHLSLTHFERKFLHLSSDNSPHILNNVRLGDVKWFEPKLQLTHQTLYQIFSLAISRPILIAIADSVSVIPNSKTYYFVSFINSKVPTIDKLTIYNTIKTKLEAKHGRFSKEQSSELFEILNNQYFYFHSSSPQRLIEAFNFIAYSKYCYSIILLIYFVYFLRIGFYSPIICISFKIIPPSKHEMFQIRLFGVMNVSKKNQLPVGMIDLKRFKNFGI